MHHALPVEEGIVYLEGDVVIVVSVASEQKGARVTVKGIVDKSHGTGHCSHNNLVSNKWGTVSGNFRKSIIVIEMYFI